MSKRNYVGLLVMALLFSVFVSGGCDFSSSDDKHSSSEAQQDDGGGSGDTPVQHYGSGEEGNVGNEKYEWERYEGHGNVPDNWTDLTGTWQPASGFITSYDASVNKVIDYKLIPDSSENFTVNVTGSGSPYTVEQGKITLYYRERASFWEDEEDVDLAEFFVTHDGSTSDMTVSGDKLSNSSVSIEENIDKDTFVFTFGSVAAGKIEGVLVQRVINAENTPSDWTSLSGTWKPTSGTLTYDDVSGKEVARHNLLKDASDSFEVTVSKPNSDNFYYLNCSRGTLYFDGDNSTWHGTDDVYGNDGNGLPFKISGGKAVHYSESHDYLYRLRSFEYVDNDHVTFVAEVLYDEEDEELVDFQNFPGKAVKRTEVISFERVN
mgnify:CR=1 FL=1